MLKSELLNKLGHTLHMNFFGDCTDDVGYKLARMEAPFILKELEDSGVKVEYSDDIGEDEEKLFGRA